jgi:hypothetical protein
MMQHKAAKQHARRRPHAPPGRACGIPQEVRDAKIEARKRGLDFIEFEEGTVRQIHVSPAALSRKNFVRIAGDAYPFLPAGIYNKATGQLITPEQTIAPTLCLRDPRAKDDRALAKVAMFNEIEILGPSRLVDRSHDPLPGGTKVFIETSARVRAFFLLGRRPEELIAVRYEGCGGIYYDFGTGE